METYFISLAAGIFAGVIYSLLKIRSPAPPVVALVGLAGILAGQELIPAAKQLVPDKAFASVCAQPSVLGHTVARRHLISQTDKTVAAAHS